MKIDRIMLFLTGFLTACTPTPTPMLLVTLAPTDTSSPTSPPSTATPTPAVERILFAPGATEVTVEGCLPANESKVYVMRVTAGQFVEMNAPVGAMGQGLCFSIVGPDGVVVKPMGDYPFRGVVPSTQGSSDPLCSGDITVVVNYNLDANGEGPKMGYVHLEGPSRRTLPWRLPGDVLGMGGAVHVGLVGSTRRARVW